MKIVRNRLIPFGSYGAINLFGIIFAKPSMKMCDSIRNHEAIHTAQMRELLYLPFYLFYIAEWLWRLIFKKGDAYRQLSFEREAYRHQDDLQYLHHRKRFAMWRN